MAGIFGKAKNLLFKANNGNSKLLGLDTANGLDLGASSFIGGVGDAIGTGVSGGFSSGAGDAIGGITNTAGSILGAVNPVLGGLVSGVGGLISGGINQIFGARLNQENINKVKNQIQEAHNFTSNVSDYDQLSSSYDSLPTVSGFNQSFIGKDGIFSNKAENLYNKLKKESDVANNWISSSLINNKGNIGLETLQNMELNYAASGGKLNNLKHQHGGIFSNGVIVIGNGGTHEENPFEGVQVGVDPQGIPNMVEEGEVIWEDYVFSNRLKVPESFKNKYKMKGKTYAEVAKQIQKESEERPNDPISKRGLRDSMMKLMVSQENIRAKEEDKESNKFDTGGIKAPELQGIRSGLDYSNIPELRAVPKIPDLQGIGGIADYSDLFQVKVPELMTPIKYDVEKTNHSTITNPYIKTKDLRYAPAIGSAIGLLDNLFSKPDYSDADRLETEAIRAGNYTPVTYSPIGNYMTYTPLDRNYYINKQASMSGATRRAIRNTSAGNRAAAVAGILASDYNSLGKVGDLMRQAEEYNLAQRQAVENFNRATNMANAEMGLQSAKTNQSARQAAAELRLKGIQTALAMRDAQDRQRAAAKSANLSNFFNNLGNIGVDEYNAEVVKNLPLLYDREGRYKKNGGCLTIKKRK